MSCRRSSWFVSSRSQIDAVVIAFVVALLTGVLSGLAPAYMAAKLDPVESLRYE